MIVAYHLVAHGKVQGVGFRATTVYTAKRMGITGWVKNSLDGTVEIVCEGEYEAIIQFIEWCKKGPSYAHVRLLQTTPTHILQNFTRFDIRY